MMTSPQPYVSPFEDRQQNLVFIVAGAVGLDARAEVLRRADRRAFVPGARAFLVGARAFQASGGLTRQGVEDRAGHDRELAVGHHLDHGGDDLAPQAASTAPNPFGAGGTQQDVFQPADGQPGDLGERLRVQRALERLGDPVVDERGGDDLAEPQSLERTSRIVSDAGVIRTADEQIAFLELVSEDERSAQIQGLSRRAAD